MPTNFAFLQHEFPLVYEYVCKAEEHVFTDPMISAILCRKGLEGLVKWLYDNDRDLELPYDTTLNSLMHEQSFQQVIPPSLLRKIHLLRKTGNIAVHSTQKTTSAESLSALSILFDFSLWVVRIYSTTQTPVTAFDESILPTGNPIKRTRAQMEALQQQYEDTRQQLERANKELKHNEALMQALQARLDAVHAIKQAHKDIVIPTSSITEAQTRSLYIDTLLKEAGWDTTLPGVAEYPVVGMPGGHGRADYVLWGDDGKPLAVVEAKRATANVHNAERQAQLYADCLEQMTGQRPIIYYTNGFETYMWDDVAGYPPRTVHGFYSKEELQVAINRRTLRQPLTAQPADTGIAGYYYQQLAIKAVAERLQARHRGALLVMATGTGKTRTAIALVNLLTKAGWAKKVLFLADRNALVTQAKRNFNALLPNLTAIDLTREDEDTASRIVFSTYPTIMNRIDSVKGGGGHRYYGVGHFDVVIVDEAHRSVYQKYRAIFNYFDAIYIGLTATPKADTDKDTYEIFGLESHIPTYAYELGEAIADGYLTEPKTLKVPLKFPRTGMKYDDLSEEEKAEYEKEFLENFGAVPREVNSSAINTWLFNKDTAYKVLDMLMTQGLKIEGGDKLGKTIIFARNYDHARFIVDCFNARYPHKANKMMQIIVSQIKNAQELIDDFSKKDNTDFQIAVSVDMLDTGIDIPEILNLVFFKPVMSRAKFWQMVGRGTRLCTNLFGPGEDKKFFRIFDICGNVEFFSAGIKEAEAPLQGTLSQQIFNERVQVLRLLQNAPATGNDDRDVATQYADALHGIVNGYNEEDFRVRMQLRYVVLYRNRAVWNALTQQDVSDIQKYLSPLYTDEQSAELTRRFDLAVLRLMHTLLQGGNTRYYTDKIKTSVKGLLRKTNLPDVKKQESLIRSVLEDEYWQNMSVATLEAMRQALRALMQYLEPAQKRALYTNFTDEMSGMVEEAEIIGTYFSLPAYKKRVEKFIRENEHNITIHRIRNNVPITKAELDELERMLYSIDQQADSEMLNKAVEGQPLGKFVRSILGLDINAAKNAFAEFLNSQHLNSSQMHFINTLIDYLCQNGTIDKDMLFDKPFTNIDDQGVAGVFPQQAGKIISIIDGINANAIQVA
jgi:type I restriction enzyme R subunit